MAHIFPLKTLHLRIFEKVIPRLRTFKYIFSPNIYVHHSARIGKGVVIKNFNGGKVYIGRNTSIERYACILTEGGDVEIGDNCSVNPFTIIYGQGGTKIGNGVRIAAHCTIIPSNHRFDDITVPIFKSGLVNKGIVIEDDVWIGTGVRILDGVVVKKGCVIGAGAVVNKSTESYGVYAGVPARKIKNRN